MDGRTDEQTDRRTNGRTDERTDGQTDGPTDIPSYRDAWTHLKTPSYRDAWTHLKTSLSLLYTPHQMIRMVIRGKRQMNGQEKQTYQHFKRIRRELLKAKTDEDEMEEA